MYRGSTRSRTQLAPPQEQADSHGANWLNTIATLLTALIAIPALTLSLVAYFDTQSEKEEGEIKEAARISWYLQFGNDGYAELLVLENRSLRPVYDAILNLENERLENEQILYIDATNSPCTRTVYNLRGHGRKINTNLRPELYFRDTLDNWWRTGYDGGLSKYPRRPDLDTGRNLLNKWDLKPRYEDLAGCG